MKQQIKLPSLADREQRDYELKRLMEDIGHMVDLRMRELRMLVSDLARLTKFTEDYVHRILAGRVPDLTLHDLVDVFFHLGLRLDFEITKMTPKEKSDASSPK